MRRIMGKEKKELSDKRAECTETGENCAVTLNKLISRI